MNNTNQNTNTNTNTNTITNSTFKYITPYSTNNNNKVSEAFFKVNAEVEEDKYNLYCYDPTGSYQLPCDIALIPTYKKSVPTTKM